MGIRDRCFAGTYSDVFRSRALTSRRNGPVQLCILSVIVATLWFSAALYSDVPDLPPYYEDRHYATSTIGDGMLRQRACASVYGAPDELVPPYVEPPVDRSPEEKAALFDMWQELESLFFDNSPSPRHILKPIGPQLPSKATLLNYTAGMAADRYLLSEEDALATRLAHERVVAGLPDYMATPELYKGGRGVIILAGGRFSGYAATTINMLRQSGSTLPVEVWAKDESEEVHEWCLELEREHGAACRRLSDYITLGSLADWLNPRSWGGSEGSTHPWSAYQWKALATVFSTFEEFLLLDADSMPVQNPDSLFESDIYNEYGAILWPDKWTSVTSPWLPYLVGLSDEPSDVLFGLRTVESGQLIWDKRKHWKSLLLAAYYNWHGPNFWYTATVGVGYGWGDKDTFPLALRSLGETFHLVETPLQLAYLGSSNISAVMAQADPVHPLGPAMFFHAHAIKWSVRGIVGMGRLDDIRKWVYAMFKPKWSKLRTQLSQKQRVLRLDSRLEEQFADNLHIDVEARIWRALEYTACFSGALGSTSSCEATRRYIQDVFGFQIKLSPEGDVCLVEAKSSSQHHEDRQ